MFYINKTLKVLFSDTTTKYKSKKFLSNNYYKSEKNWTIEQNVTQHLHNEKHLLILNNQVMQKTFQTVNTYLFQPTISEMANNYF